MTTNHEPRKGYERLDEAYALLVRQSVVLEALNAVKVADQMPRALRAKYDDLLDFAIRQTIDTVASIHSMEDDSDLLS